MWYMESPEDRERWQLYVRAIDALTGKKVWDDQQISSFHYGRACSRQPVG